METLRIISLIILWCCIVANWVLFVWNRRNFKRWRKSVLEVERIHRKLLTNYYTPYVIVTRQMSLWIREHAQDLDRACEEMCLTDEERELCCLGVSNKESEVNENETD